MKTRPVHGAMYCVIHDDFSLEGSASWENSDGEQCDGADGDDVCDLRDLFIEDDPNADRYRHTESVWVTP